MFDNTASHDDVVDSPDDVSWAKQGLLPAGHAALRVLMTDAPVDADNVFVTFCGIFVEPVGSTADEQGPVDAEQPERDEPEAEELEPKQPDAEQPDAEQPDAEQPDAEQPEQPEAEELKPDQANPERRRTDKAASAGEPAAQQPAAADWYPISDQCQTLDLLTLQGGITEAMGIATLPPGQYGQIRLMLTEASIVVGGVEHALVVPSGAESGLKIGGGFTLHPGEATTIQLDFDAGKSVHYAPGNGYMMSPVIDLIDVEHHNQDAEDAEREEDAEDAEREEEDAEDAEYVKRDAEDAERDAEREEDDTEREEDAAEDAEREDAAEDAKREEDGTDGEDTSVE